MKKVRLAGRGKGYGSGSGGKFLLLSAAFLCAGLWLFALRGGAFPALAGEEAWQRETALFLWSSWYPGWAGGGRGETEEDLSHWLNHFLMRQLPYYREEEEGSLGRLEGEADPSFGGYLEGKRVLADYEALVKSLEGSALVAGNTLAAAGDFSGGGMGGAGAGSAGGGESGSAGGTGNVSGDSISGSSPADGAAGGKMAEAAAGETAGSRLLGSEGENGSGIRYLSQQLADYDFLMKHFYTVHPTAAAGRDLMKAKTFLEKDLSLEEGTEGPQILIYHSHSQEEFSDYHQGNKEATIVGVGDYLTKLLEAKGYRVLHDTSVYDLKDGKLDRSRAYTYSLEGITAILQKNPSIQVVLDIHRDGVADSTHLVTEVNGKKTATIMFFNGTSETPEGPIEYLPNPYREDNLAFSFQMKLCADAAYPNFTRKIYLKGLRYNLHVRPRSALIEVGAQNNTYEEALNAMEPLSELLDMVLRPRG